MANCAQCGRKLPGLSFGKKLCQWCVEYEAAKRGEVAEDAPQRVMPAPWVRRETSMGFTQVLLGVNVVVFLGLVRATGAFQTFPTQALAEWGANVGQYTLGGEWWRLLTYMFLHGGIIHIALNMWGLWNLGTACESLYGRWTFASIYILTGIGGGLASAGWNPGVVSVGASGAIFGLIGALIASFYLGEFSLPRAAIQGNLKSLVVVAAMNLYLGATVPNIDNADHIGGLVTGLILGALIAVIAPQYDAPVRRVSVVLIVSLALGGTALGIQHWRGFPMHVGRASFFPQGNSGQIIAQLQKRVEKSPKDITAHYALAHAYFARGQYSEASTELNRILDLQPQNSAVRLELGGSYLAQGQSKEAQDAFTKVIAQEPNNANAHAGLGLALADQQNHLAAIGEYQIASRLSPKAKDIYYRMGISQTHLQQYDDAIASFLKERENSGDDADLENSLAEAYEGKGMTQQATDARNKAAQLRGEQ